MIGFGSRVESAVVASEAIQIASRVDCFVASSLAMTAEKI
jgi:hypothetical protein